MSKNKYSSAIVKLNSPKGYGKIGDMEFSNAITLYGKAQMLNAILRGFTVTPTAIRKITGISLLFRRCHDTSLENGTLAKLVKSFFEVNLVKTAPNISHTKAHTESDTWMTTGSSGDHDVDGKTCWFQCQNVTAGVDINNWGDSQQATVGYVTDRVHVGANLPYNHEGADDYLHTQAPYASGVGLDNTTEGKKYARLAGIALLTSDYGDIPVETENGEMATLNNALPTSKKVWRDPSFWQLVHDQENYNKGFGLTNAVLHDGTAGHTQRASTSSDDVTHNGHYFPSKGLFEYARHNATDGVTNTGVGSNNVAVSEADDLGDGAMDDEFGFNARIITGWSWKDCAHDTFAFSGFLTHYYGTQDETVLPYNTGSIAEQAFQGESMDAYSDFSATINLVYGDESAEGGDNMLSQTIGASEVSYDALGSNLTDNMIDYNDTITAKYTIDFDATVVNINTEDGLNTSFNDNLAESLAKDFGQDSGEWAQSLTSSLVNSAIAKYSIFDAQGELMIDANPGGGGDLNKLAIEIAVADGDTIISSGYHKEIKMDVNGIDFGNADDSQSTSKMESNFVETHGKKVEFKPWNDPQTTDMVKRPRQVQSTVRIKIPNIKRNSIGLSGGEHTTVHNPHKIKFYNGAGTPLELLEITLIDVNTGGDGATAGDGNQFEAMNPFITTGQSTEVLKVLSDGDDFGVNKLWEDGNNLIVDITFFVS